MKRKIAQAILRTLLAADPEPMPEAAIHGAVIQLCRAEKPTCADFDTALQYCETEGWVCGVSDPLTGRSWSLTESGRHKARQL
jgi:hypothetical protein